MAGRMSRSQPGHVGKRRTIQVDGIACAKVLRQEETDPFKKPNGLCESRLTGAEGEH